MAENAVRIFICMYFAHILFYVSTLNASRFTCNTNRECSFFFQEEHVISEVWRPQTYRYKEQGSLDSRVGRGHRDRSVGLMSKSYPW